MFLRITDINPDRSRVHIEIAPDTDSDFLAQLEAFVDRCVIENICHVHILYRSGTSPGNIQRLEELAALKKLPAPAVSGSNETGSQSWPSPTQKATSKKSIDSNCENALHYQLRIDGLDEAVEKINKSIAIIGTSLNLDPRSTLLLRLCAYELSMNTVEHGDFSSRTPTIDLEMRFSESRAGIVYRDNSEQFSTVRQANPALIGDNIFKRSKRGLGLYMINMLCTDIGYERIGDWNKSTFSLEINREQTVTEKG